MNGWLSCDDVFERLTRGPFPTCEPEDTAVEAHLAGCHDCRSLAEALRPAVRLFADVRVAELQPAGDLPVYWGSAATLATPPASAPVQTRPKETETSWGWQLVAAALLGVVLGAGAAGGWFIRPTSRSANGLPPEQRFASLQSLPLHEACLRHEKHPNGATGVRCCTLCHHARAGQKAPTEIRTLQLACALCHTR